MLPAMGDYCRPMFAADEAHQKGAGLIGALEGDFQELRVVPQFLCFREIEAVLLLVGLTFPLVEFKIHLV